LLAEQVLKPKASVAELACSKQGLSISWRAPSGKPWPVLQLTKEKHGQILRKCQAKIVSAEQLVSGLTSA